MLQKNTAAGAALALTACILWSFNFIVARGISTLMPPVSVSFYRWLTASVIMVPIACKSFWKQKHLVLKHWRNLLFATLSGIALYSPLIYIAGHYSPAINLALIGTTITPVITFFIAAVFLKEKIPPLRLLGLAICIAGTILLLSNGSWQTIIHFKFSLGDKWMLLGATLFAVYNIVVRKKSPELLPLTFLFVTFIAGTILLFPMFLVEASHTSPVHWNTRLLLIMLYSGAGTSVAAFFCWNAAIARIGSAKTAVFGNLIPVMASFEAVLLLGEKITVIQVASMVVVTAGLVLATVKK